MEKLDIYNSKRERTGKQVERLQGGTLEKGEYIISLQGWVINAKGEILLTQRSKTKTHPGMWEPTSGLLTAGEESIDGMIREIKEEIGLDVSKDELVLVKKIIEKRKDINFFRDIYVIKKDITLKDIKFSDREVIAAKFVTIKKLMEMIENKEAFEWLKYFEEIYKKIMDE